MFCSNCGNKIKDGANFCSSCGAPAKEDKAPKKRMRKQPAPAYPAEDVKISENITFCRDGKYRWTYEMSLFTNPTIFLLIWKIFFFIILGIFAFVILLDLQWGVERLLNNLKFLGYILGGMTVLVGLGYLIYAAIMGGKYVVDFEMDEKGVNHSQAPAQAKKARAIGRAAMIAGAASGRLSTVGAGMNAQRTEMYSEFAKVRKVKAYPSRRLIKVNCLLEHNQVYAAKEDFDFVKDYIVSRCTNTKARRKEAEKSAKTGN